MFKQGASALYPSLIFARLDLDAHLDVARFMCLLFRVPSSYYEVIEPGTIEPDWVWKQEPFSFNDVEDATDSEDGYEEPTVQDSRVERSEHLEWTWGMQAPHMRLGRLLWLHLQGSDAANFRNRFVRGPREIYEDTRSASAKLRRIQSDLRRVLRAFEEVQQLSREVGQAQAGEAFFLPPAEAELLREHLRRAHPDLLTQQSSFQELASARLRHLTCRSGYLEVPSLSDSRIYLGKCFGPDRGVWVSDGSAQWSLKDASDPWQRPDFNWGYHGGGPHDLARSLLADATGGLSCFAGHEEPFGTVRQDFVEEVIAKLDSEADFTLTRTEVWQWLLGKGFTADELHSRQAAAKSNYDKVRPWIEHWVTACETSLVAQRFDLVPPDFECAIYVDLLNYIQHGGRILFCELCGQAIPDGLSGSAHRRSRSLKGLPVYHPACFQTHRAASKREGAREYARRPEVKAKRVKQRSDSFAQGR